MRATVALLLIVLSLPLLEVNAPRRSASLGAVMGQTSPSPTNKPATVEERRSVLNELEASIRLALSKGETLEAARSLTRAGGLQLLLNDPKAAVASHLQALDLLRQSPDPHLVIDNLTGAGAAYLNMPPSNDPNAPDNLDLAQAALEEAIKSSRDIHYTTGEAEALLLLSERQNLANHATAVITAREALAIWKNENNKDGLARAYNKIGTYYYAQNLVAEASENWERALTLWRGLNDKVRQGSVLISLAFVEYRKADWEASVSYLGRAYPMLDEQAEPLQMGRLAAGLGASFMESGSLELAVTQYQRALDFYRRAEDRSGIGYTTRNLGLLSFLSGDLNQSINYLEEALKAYKYDLGTASVLEIRGRVHTERGEYAAALEDLESALKLYTKIGNPNEAARVLALIGQAYYRQGSSSRARNYYEQALTAFVTQHDRVNQSAVYYALGKMEMKLRDYDAASEHLRQSIAVTEGIRLRPSADLMSAFSASVQDRYEAYVECLMRQHELQPTRGFAVKAFETSELGRARTLSEMLLAMQANLAPGVDPKLAARQKLLTQVIRLRENDRIGLLASAAGQAKLKALEDEIGRLEAEFKTVSDTIRSRFPAYDEISRPTAWDLSRIESNVLSDDDVLLEYILGAENSYAWTITRNEFTSYKLGPQKNINEAGRRVYDLLSNTPTAGSEAELKKATAELSRLVVAPVAAALNKKRIILVADGSLNYIPFQLLLNSSTNNEPLIANYEIVNVPSASILGQLRHEKQQRRPGTKVLAAFGDPVFASNYAQYKDSSAGELLAAANTEIPKWQHAWRDIEVEGDKFDPYSIQPLLYTKRELKNLTDIAGPQSRVVSGFEASRKTLDSLDLSQYSILHFATHGLLDPKRPEHSGFFLSMIDQSGRPQDGFITMQDVYRLHAPVDLVVLSACRTGLGKDVRGEGLIGLTRGFMYAGASSVVASLWRVDDEATAELMKQFYTNMLQKGMRPAEALRSAQNTLRQNPEWQSPHFWAGFVLQGEFKEPIRIPVPTGAPRAVQNAVGIVFLLLLLTLIAWGYLRRRAT
jgi:CHAT domain-containing protein/predicted negative regulator of RcsB-dependent stress response